jgi:hypothetical protein
MTKPKTGSDSRRGFLARLAAMGTVLGGVVPELRAYGTSDAAGLTPQTTLLPYPPTPLPTPTPPTVASQVLPLSASETAILYSSALADSDVQLLLASAGPGSVVMPPDNADDLGSLGRGITLPVHDSSGVKTASLFFGNISAATAGGQTASLPIKCLVKSDRSLAIAVNSRVVQPPQEKADLVEVLYASAFTNKYIEEQANRVQVAARIGEPPRRSPRAPRATPAVCLQEFHLCMLFEPIPRRSQWESAACLACLGSMQIPGGVPASVYCYLVCQHANQAVQEFQLRRQICDSRYWNCMRSIGGRMA